MAERCRVVSKPEEAFESETTAAERWFYEEAGKRFWIRNASGNWVSLPELHFRKYLRTQGIAAKKDDDAVLSEMDEEILTTIMEQRVDYAGIVAGCRRGMQEYEDRRILVTQSPTLIEPEQGQWDLLFDFLSGLFGLGEEAERKHDQLQLLFGWWQHALRSLYDGEPSCGMALALAGPAGCGKTFVKDVLRVSMGGREVYPYQFMVGRDIFNKNLVESPLWVVDDEQSSTRYSDRLAFGDVIKKVTSNTSFSYRGMHRESVVLRSLRRLIICLNNEPEKIIVLPPIDDDIADKMLLMMTYTHQFPRPMDTEPQKRAFFEEICAELPHLIYFLLEEFQIPKTMLGRFGVTHWHHPVIAGELYAMGQEVQLMDWIDRYLQRRSLQEWEGTAEDLRRELLGQDSPLYDHEMREVAKANVIGKQLSKIQRRHPDRVSRQRTNRNNQWQILRGSSVEGVEAEEGQSEVEWGGNDG